MRVDLIRDPCSSEAIPPSPRSMCRSVSLHSELSRKRRLGLFSFYRLHFIWYLLFTILGGALEDICEHKNKRWLGHICIHTEFKW